jgi:hypothetical protein
MYILYTYTDNYCESTVLLQNALIHGFLNSWFQTLPATINGKIVFRYDFYFRDLIGPRNHRKLEPHD